MSFGSHEIAGRGLDLSKEAVGSQTRERLIWSAGALDCLGCFRTSGESITCRKVVARPGTSSVGLSQHTTAPGEPIVVRCQPGMSARKIARVQAEIGREALQEQSLLMDDIAGLSHRSIRKEGLNLLPRNLRFA